MPSQPATDGSGGFGASGKAPAALRMSTGFSPAASTSAATAPSSSRGSSNSASSGVASYSRRIAARMCSTYPRTGGRTQRMTGGRRPVGPYNWMWVQVAERIRADVTAAMKAGDRNRVTALRLVLSELQKAAKEGSDDELAVLRRERKRRRESEQAYREAGRQDLAEAEAYEAGAIEAYPPAELSDDELDALVAGAVAETGASSQRDMGRVIKQVMAAAGGRADGRKVSTKVKEALS